MSGFPLESQAVLTANALANLERAIRAGEIRDLQYIAGVIGQHALDLHDAARKVRR